MSSSPSLPDRVAVVIAHYSRSGVPLAQIRLAKALAARGYLVDFIVGYVPPGLSVDVIPGVNLIHLNRQRAVLMVPKLVRYLIQAGPRAIFSAEDHVNAMVLVSAIISGSRSKISASSRVNPFDHYSNRLLSRGWFLKQVMRRVMWRADALTCVSKDMVHQYQEIFGSTKHFALYNIVRTAQTELLAREAVDHDWFRDISTPVIVAAGVLEVHKGFVDLVRAFAIVRQERPVRLMVLGEGSQRRILENLTNSLGVGADVDFHGHVANPLKFFSRSSVFVLSSRLEGMPNVMIEAMANGCTPVATDCPTGPREILGSGRYGYLVPLDDPAALARGIISALDFPIPRELLDEAVRPFEEGVVVDQQLRAVALCPE